MILSELPHGGRLCAFERSFCAPLLDLRATTPYRHAPQARGEQAESRKALQEMNTSKWAVLLEHAFGCETPSPMSKEEARRLAIDIVDALQDEQLLRQVESERTGLLSKLSDQERQHMVARAVVGVQSEVIERHGFKGDAGFAQAQAGSLRPSREPRTSYVRPPLKPSVLLRGPGGVDGLCGGRSGDGLSRRRHHQSLRSRRHQPAGGSQELVRACKSFAPAPRRPRCRERRMRAAEVVRCATALHVRLNLLGASLL